MGATRVVNAVAPVRVCDLGGWTDTWFAGHGSVLNIAVSPVVEVQLRVRPRRTDDPPVLLHAENFGDRYTIVPGGPLPDRHPLLEAAVDELGVPDDLAVEITLWSEIPAGCSTGTSAAVTVALVGALDSLTPGRLTPHEVARTAHRIEAERVGLQSGVQDQVCSALGGINLVDIPAYPNTSARRLDVPDELAWELDRRLVLLFLGRHHVSSAVHEKVIAELEHEGPEAPRLQLLRDLATAGCRALEAGDLDAFGHVMSRNTAAQAELHPDLVNPDALQAIDIARAHGALGWKVNGAGGEGGSLTLLAGEDAGEQRAMVQALHEADPLFQVIPTALSRHGLRVWESPQGSGRDGPL